MTYFGPAKGALSGTNTLKVAEAGDAWVECNGKTTPTTRTNSIASAMTWQNKASIDATKFVVSAPFDVTATAKVGTDSTYSGN